MNPDAGRVLGGRYRLERPLGEGSMGVVWEATQLNIGRSVVVKILQSSLPRQGLAMQRFRREAEAAGRLQHPNIVQITDFVDEDGEPPFLVMERLDGRTLDDAIQAEAPFETGRAVAIARQILDALAAAHGARIVHRDLKPDNIFLTSAYGVRDVVKLLDFGIAKLWDDDDAQKLKLTATGALLGTPTYMAPEQASGKPVDARADLHAVGVLLYEMLTGRPPHDEKHIAGLLAAILQDPITPPHERRPEIDPSLSAIVMRALDKDPDARFATAEEMSRALDTGFPGAATSPGPDRTPSPGPPRKPKRRALLYGAAFLLPFVVIGSFLIAFFLAIDSPAAPPGAPATSGDTVRPITPIAPTEGLPLVPSTRPLAAPDAGVETEDDVSPPTHAARSGQAAEEAPRDAPVSRPAEPEAPEPDTGPGVAEMVAFAPDNRSLPRLGVHYHEARRRRRAIATCFRHARSPRGTVVRYRIQIAASGANRGAHLLSPSWTSQILIRCAQLELARRWPPHEEEVGFVVAYEYR